MSDSELAKQQQVEDQKNKQLAATSELGLMPANLGSVLSETSSKKKGKYLNFLYYNNFFQRKKISTYIHTNFFKNDF